MTLARCYDCETTDVAVKLTDQWGCEHFFCAADWRAHEEFRAAPDAFFEDALSGLEPTPC